MINVHDFLKENINECGSFAFVTIDNDKIPLWFSRLNNGKDIWFLESECCVFRICDVKNIKEFCNEYIKDLLEEGEDEQAYINKFILPMIVDNVFYEIVNFETAPFLPQEVENIELTTEHDCLLAILTL